MPSTLPNLAKTWQFDVNQEIEWQGTAALHGAQILYLLKESLRGFVLAPWTVRGSSNGVTAGFDTVDRWLSRANITWANDASARSWIVLQQTGLIGIGNPPTTGFQILIDCSTTVSTAGFSCRLLVSPTGSFSGGAINSRPTAPDEILVNGVERTQQQWLWNNGDGRGTTFLHVMQSSDGECTRWFTTHSTGQGPQLGGIGMYELLQNANDGLLYPAVSYGSRYLGRDYLFTRNNGTEPFVANQGAAGTAFYSALTVEGTSDTMLPYRELTPDQLQQAWVMHPVGIWVPNTAGFRARIGAINDLWTTSYVLPDGTMFPEDGTKEFVKYGGLIWPWNGESFFMG